MRGWIEVRIEFDTDPGDLLVRLQDGQGGGVLGAWQDGRLIRLYWRHERWSDDTRVELERCIEQLGGSPKGMVVESLPERDWNAIWARSIKPIRIGMRIIIRPSWETVAAEPGCIELILDPKQAFGTGHHPTTRLLLEWLEEIIRGGERVLDVGTGSGVLAMVALRLGACRAVGIDHDPLAVECAQGYARENGFGRELTFEVSTLAGLPGTEAHRFDLMVANLDRATLLDSAGLYGRWLQPGGRLLLSGLLSEDRGEVEEAFRRSGASVCEARESDGWLALALTHPVRSS